MATTPDPWKVLRDTKEYSRLIERLQQGKAIFNTDDDQLRGAFVSLAAAYDFLRTDANIAKPPGLAEPLSALARALADHLGGSRHTMLAVRTRQISSSEKHAG